MKSTKVKVTLISLLVLILIGAMVASAVLLAKHFTKKDSTGDESELTQTIEDVDTFIDVDKNFALLLCSEAEIQKSDLKVVDQNGNSADFNLANTDSRLYAVQAPAAGWEEGNTYKLTLLDNEIKFRDEGAYDKRSVTFTVDRQEVLNVETKDNVISIENSEPFETNLEGSVVYIEPNIIAAEKIEKGSVILVPTKDEFGFTVQTAYKVTNIAGNVVSVEKPEYDEIFDELDVKGTFSPVMNEDYVHFYEDQYIEEQILESAPVKELAAKSESNSLPKVKLSLSMQGQDVKFKYSVTFPKFFEDFDFVMEGSSTISIGAKANVNITKTTFDLGANLKYKNEVKFSLVMKSSLGESGEGVQLFKNASKKLQNMLNKNSKAKKFATKIFEMYIPTPIPALGFSFEVSVNFKLEAKIELGVTFTDEFSLSTGVKKDSDGINPYFNKTVKKETTKIELCGSIEAKLGLSVKFSGSICGVLKAGVEFEIGAYAKLAGFVKAQTINQITDGVESENTFAGSGVYFEVGIYSNLNLFAELDLKIVKFDVKVGLVEIKVPILSIGNTQSFEIIPEVDAVVFDEEGNAKLPDVTIKTCDMFTGKTETQKVEAEELTGHFNFEYDRTKVEQSGACDVYVVNKGLEEFNTEFNLKLKSWQFFLPEIDISAGAGGTLISIKGSRGLVHYEVGALNAICSVTLSKQPIAVEQLTLGYESVTKDDEYKKLHPELAENELPYNVRDEINGIKDYQIGRLVKVVPEFVPSNASYKKLKYTVEKGEQYIVGGAEGLSEYTDGGVTYAVFRIAYDETAIGNVDGITDVEKEIKITAVTTGYSGKYANWNKTDDTESGVYASSVPVINFKITPMVEDQCVGQTAVQAGATVQFAIDKTSVFPKNATRGELANEILYVKSGKAKIINLNEVVIESTAEVGSQIVVASMLSGVEREYFLNIIKTDIESIELAASVEAAKPGDNVTLTYSLTGEGGKTPTVKEVVYVIASGGGYADVSQSATINTSLLNISEEAKVGSAIKLFAIADGQRSNTVEIEIGKIPVDSVSFVSGTNRIVHKGETVQLQSAIYPANASNKEVRYTIVSGEQYAVLDSRRGKLVVSNLCVGEEIIEVQCEADGVKSSILKFTVQNTSVQYVKFPREYATVKCGQTIRLDAFVNPDATNKEIIYSITSGSEFASISGDLLIINDGLNTFDEITVCAAAASDNTVYAEKRFTVYADKASLSINGEYDNAVMFTGEKAMVVVTDSSGVVVDNQDVRFTITCSGQSTGLASIDSQGCLTVSSKVSETYSDSLQIVLESDYNGIVKELYIDILICPDSVELVSEDNEDIKTAELKPGEQIVLKVIYAKQDNAAELNNIELEVSDNLNAYIESVDEGYGIISYRIFAQVSANALTGETCTIKAKYIAAGKNLATSSAFVITVGKLTEEVHILNVPETLNIAESFTLVAAGYPENNNYSPKFEFADLNSKNYAKLNSATGELIINNNADLSGRKITLRAVIDDTYSQIYTIEIKDEIRSVKIASGRESTGVQYIPEYDFYFLYPNGKFVVSAEKEGGAANSEIHYTLDAVGERYLSISGNEITVKDNVKNHGINATLVAYADNGVVSNTIVIYIPIAVSTAEEWFDIKDNIAGYYVLTNDIDFKGMTFSPLAKFGGIIDGCGYSILNVSVSQTNRDGCFGLIEENHGMIFNLTVGRFSVKLTEADKTVYGGAICAKNYGYINNCKVVSSDQIYVDILISNINTYIGGICGKNFGTVKNSMSQVRINSYGYAAGIVGLNAENGIIDNCNNRGYISALDGGENTFKGIAGYNLGIITNSTNYGKTNYKNI